MNYLHGREVVHRDLKSMNVSLFVYRRYAYIKHVIGGLGIAG